MSEKPLLRPVLASITVLIAGVAALVARAEVVQWRWGWDGYRHTLATVAKSQARIAAGTLDPKYALPVPPARHLTARWVLESAALQTPAVAVLTIGILSLVLIAHGRRFAWLPVASGAMYVNDAILSSADLGHPVSGVSHYLAMIPVAVAVLPVMWATRGRSLSGYRLPRVVAVSAAVLVALPAAFVYVGPHAGDVPEPLAALTAFAYGVLVTASTLPRRWLPTVLVAPVLAVPAVGWGLGEFLVGGGADEQARSILVALALLVGVGVFGFLPLPARWRLLLLSALVVGIAPVRESLFATLTGLGGTPPDFAGPMVLALAAVATGAIVPLYGAKVVDGCRAALGHGPTLALPRSTEVAA